MSGNTQVYQTTTPPTTSGGVLGSGYSALCATAMGTSLINLYEMLNIQNELKALNIKNIQNEAEAQSIATIEAGKKERMGSFIQAGAQLGQSASGLYTAGKGVASELDYQNKMGEFEQGTGNNLRTLSKQINEKPIAPEQSLIEDVIANPKTITGDNKLLVQNHATEEQQELIREAMRNNPANKAELGEFLKSVNSPRFEDILTGKLKVVTEGAGENITEIQRELSPGQRQKLLDRTNLLETDKLPEVKRIKAANEKETTKQNLWSQQIFGPFAQATGQAGHGIYTAEAAQDRAAGQLAGAAEQMARDSNNTVGTTLDMITRVIEALMSAQATMAQKTA